MAIIDALGSPMYYEDTGAGIPFVFLHGNPTSSYLWRNVLPAVSAEARCLAPDLIGMGRSGKPGIGYTFADQARYLDAWFDALGLGSVVLVGHDWGGVLAFDWAARHPGRVRGLTFLETIVRPMTWPDYPAAARDRFRAYRTPDTGERLVLDENVFITQALHSTVLTPLTDADLAEYAQPYPTPGSRRPLLEWPRAIPLEGEPADVVARVEAYDRWLAASSEVPKLLLTFDGSPTLGIGPETAAWCAANIASLESEYCGPAGHLAPEDQPGAITAAVTAWAARHGLTKP
jgi:haloalkane dehalogenase